MIPRLHVRHCCNKASDAERPCGKDETNSRLQLLEAICKEHALAIGFGTPDRLAAAYGIAVSATMPSTTVLLSMAMRNILR